ncbi:hypothetical protein QO021_28485 (plasmid) [Pseudomonas amygdali pv. lachrymans]|nr:hypothetical protein [Pseudomonas amygdali]WIO61497.1 hypothetical protein QO021_28485 [Pseudomonas amygdali pv. lachrymans]
MNKALTTTGIYRPGQPPQLFPEFDAHLNRMQELAFRIGDRLLSMPPGTLASISETMQVGIVTLAGKIETAILQHYSPLQSDEDVQWFCFTKQKYQDCDWGGEEQIDEIIVQLEDRLALPVFTEIQPAQRLQTLAKGLEDWIENYESPQLS